MSDRTQLIGVLLLVAAFVGGYAVCRRPQAGPQINSEPKADAEAPAPEAGDWSPQAIPDERLRRVVQELIDRWEKLDAVLVNIKTTMPEAAGMPGKTEGTASYSMQRRDSKTLTRFRIFNSFTIDTFGEEKGKKIITGEEILQMFDGDTLYLSINQPERQAVTKAVYDPARIFHIGGRHLFELIFADSNVELVGEETIGDWQTYVLLSRPRGGDWSTKYWLDKETGVQVKLVETSSAGVAQLTMNTESINTKPEFAPDRFKIVIPDTYEIIDETAKQP